MVVEECSRYFVQRSIQKQQQRKPYAPLPAELLPGRALARALARVLGALLVLAAAPDALRAVHVAWAEHGRRRARRVHQQQEQVRGREGGDAVLKRREKEEK